VIPFGVGFTALLAVAYFLMLSHYRRRISAHIEELSKYIRRLDSGDYSLDIRDNGEGSLSQLKNDLYKITVRLREQAQILKREKLRLSDAIADISHQIKTPLTSLSVLADLLSGDPPEADRRTFVEQLRPQLGRIQWLITALLKLSRLDAGTAGLKREPVNILRLIEHAIEPLRIPMELKGQQITVRGDPSAGFQGDFQWSAEALTNLVKNGVEHSQEGGRIEISFRANPLYAEIQVTDHGEGIASEDQPLIFNRFFRGKNAGEYSIGIGLALAKAIFLEQGGDITVASQPGQGTTFTVKVFQGIT
jgi:signal transduction histidine kinase